MDGHTAQRKSPRCGRLARSPAPLPLVLIAGLALVGCAAERSSRSATLTGFVARARPICASEAEKLRYIRSRARLVGAHGVLRREAAAGQAATASLERLPRPVRATSQIERWFTARTVAATVAIDLAEAPAHGAERAASDVALELRRARGRADALALSLGARSCRGAV
jgi:hypothetical protein